MHITVSTYGVDVDAQHSVDEDKTRKKWWTTRWTELKFAPS